MRQFHKRNRKENASFIAEAPFALWVLFFFFTVPFLDMATVLLRYTFIVAAARDGVHAAAHSKTFLSGTSNTLSAISAATAQVNQTAGAFSEISVSSVQTRILETNISTQLLNAYPYNQPLNQVADESSYLYEIETMVVGTINPLLNMNIGIVPPIPGLTTGVPVTLSAREYCEYPQGLNQ